MCKSLQLAARHISVIWCSFYSVLQPVVVEQVHVNHSYYRLILQPSRFNLLLHVNFHLYCCSFLFLSPLPLTFHLLSEVHTHTAVIAASSCDGHLDNSDGNSSIAMWVRKHRL